MSLMKQCLILVFATLACAALAAIKNTRESGIDDHQKHLKEEAVYICDGSTCTIYSYKGQIIKILNNPDLLYSEAAINCHLPQDSPYLVKFYGWKLSERHLYFEYLNGGDGFGILEFYARGKGLGEHLGGAVVFFVAAGLKDLHNLKIIHRDLKLENIFFTTDGRVKIGDFGLSTTLMSTDQMRRQWCGTPGFRAPRASAELQYMSEDIWALGVVSFMLITGTPPLFPNHGGGENWDGLSDDIRDLINRIFGDGGVSQYEGLSKEWQVFIASCLQLDEAKRPSAKDLLDFDAIKHISDADATALVKPLVSMVMQTKQSACQFFKKAQAFADLAIFEHSPKIIGAAYNEMLKEYQRACKEIESRAIHRLCEHVQLLPPDQDSMVDLDSKMNSLALKEPAEWTIMTESWLVAAKIRRELLDWTQNGFVHKSLAENAAFNRELTIWKAMDPNQMQSFLESYQQVFRAVGSRSGDEWKKHEFTPSVIENFVCFVFQLQRVSKEQAIYGLRLLADSKSRLNWHGLLMMTEIEQKSKDDLKRLHAARIVYLRVKASSLLHLSPHYHQDLSVLGSVELWTFLSTDPYKLRLDDMINCFIREVETECHGESPLWEESKDECLILTNTVNIFKQRITEHSTLEDMAVSISCAVRMASLGQ